MLVLVKDGEEERHHGHEACLDHLAFLFAFDLFLEFGVWGLGFGVWGLILGFGVWNLGFGVWG